MEEPQKVVVVSIEKVKKVNAPEIVILDDKPYRFTPGAASFFNEFVDCSQEIIDKQEISLLEAGTGERLVSS